MKKISGLALVSLMLVGCAASQPPAMPVDSNPSDALKFARAMDLRQITDAGDTRLAGRRGADRHGHSPQNGIREEDFNRRQEPQKCAGHCEDHE